VQLLDSVDDLPDGLRFVISVGVFDGLHRGHAHMLRTAASAAGRLDAEPVVLTFDPHPDELLRGAAPPLLCDPAEKLARLEAAGVGVTVRQRFDKEFADQRAEDFLRRLARDRSLAGVVMTDETAFGRDRAGTLAAVAALCPEIGFEIVYVPELLVGGRRVSSSRLREVLAAGRMGEAKRLLGRDYAVIGEVVAGERRGKELGFPTANLLFSRPVALPRDGIYAVRASWGGADPLAPAHHADGVASLGVRPTFGAGERLLEVHLFDFEGDLYGQRLRVEFVRRQRGESRFASAEALIRQMGLDAARARHILSGAGPDNEHLPRSGRSSDGFPGDGP
jgi:riboflavin kinase / FMN adenylyltransferase